MVLVGSYMFLAHNMQSFTQLLLVFVDLINDCVTCPWYFGWRNMVLMRLGCRSTNRVPIIYIPLKLADWLSKFDHLLIDKFIADFCFSLCLTQIVANDFIGRILVRRGIWNLIYHFTFVKKKNVKNCVNIFTLNRCYIS